MPMRMTLMSSPSMLVTSESVTEVRPVRALEAAMDGFRVMPMAEAAKIGDILVTVTGDVNVISREHFQVMKDGAILANSGHFNVELNIAALEEMAEGKRQIRPHVVQYRLKDGRRIFLLGEGRLINLAAAEGHPASVMDMSFANQALCAEHIARRPKRLSPAVHRVPTDIDQSPAVRSACPRPSIACPPTSTRRWPASSFAP